VCGKPRKAKSAGRSRVNDLGPVYPSSRSPLFSSASPTREPILFARNVSRNLESANQSDGCATRITANYRDKAASRRGTRRILDIYMLIIHYPDHNNTGTIAGELLRGRAVGREIRATSRDFRTAANPVARDAFVRGGVVVEVYGGWRRKKSGGLDVGAEGVLLCSFRHRSLRELALSGLGNKINGACRASQDSLCLSLLLARTFSLFSPALRERDFCLSSRRALISTLRAFCFAFV